MPLDAEDLNPAMLAQLSKQASLEMSAPPPAHDANTGAPEPENGELEPETEDDTYGYEDNEPPPPAVVAAVEEPEPAADEPEEPVELDVSAMKDKRLRLNSFKDEDLKAVLLAKRNPDAMDLADALIATYGRETLMARLGIELPAAKESADAPKESAPAAAATTVDALQDEIDALDDQVAEHTANFETEEAERVRQTLKAKRRELTKMLQQAAAPVPAAHAEPKLSTEQFERLYDADLNATISKFPDFAREDSPLWQEVQKEYEQAVAKGDPAVTSWDVNSQIVQRVAARLNLKPTTAKASAAPAAKPAARPGPVIGKSASQTTRPPVDTAALREKLTPHTLALLLHGGH